jgi:hypothetical protein
MKSILDNSFRYTPSFRTDLAKRFANMRKEQRKLNEARALDGAKVVPITQSPMGKSHISDR